MAAATNAKRVLVTGAAGQIAYSLIFQICQGEMLGRDQPLILHMLDIPVCEAALQGVVMELEDCAFPLLHGVVATSDIETAFRNVDYACLVGAMPRKEGMERADLLKANAGIFKVQGAALAAYASPNVRVVVVGNPANTNALLTLESAGGKLKPSQVSALTRLDHNRAIGALAKRLGGAPTSVKNVTIWGNHSATQYPDVSQAVFTSADGKTESVEKLVADQAYLQGPFIKLIQQRGAAVIAARKLSSAASAAKAIVDHMRDWIRGTAEGHWVSMGIPSDGSYGIAPGVIYSYPVTCKDGEFHIVQGLPISDFSRGLMTATEQELRDERTTALSFLAGAAAL